MYFSPFSSRRFAPDTLSFPWFAYGVPVTDVGSTFVSTSDVVVEDDEDDEDDEQEEDMPVVSVILLTETPYPFSANQ